MQTLLNIKEEWILKLQNAKNDNDKKIAMKRIQKINDELGIFDEENEKRSVADIMSEKLPKIDINLEEINQEISKLERLYAKFKDPDYLDEISVLKSKIGKAKEKLNAHKIANAPNVKKFYSETLKMNFVMNKEQEKVIFEDGAVYTFRELHLLHNSEPKLTKKDVDFLHTFKIFKGEFFVEYQERTRPDC